MIRDQFILHIQHELIVDNFAGGGGASCGIELALGRHVDYAIHHDPEAVAMHAMNHPQTEHHCESVWDVDPVAMTKGRSVGFGWFSPDCKHFSKAKGGKPRDKNIRGLAFILLRWLLLTNMRVFSLENVEEFVTWGHCSRSHPANSIRTPLERVRRFRDSLRCSPPASPLIIPPSWTPVRRWALTWLATWFGDFSTGLAVWSNGASCGPAITARLPSASA
jgi:DNA (cytosine-5)-methyltransferase 1